MHENLLNIHKNVQKRYKTFKPRLRSVLSTGTNIVKTCALQALLGLQSIVVNCIAAISFSTVDCVHTCTLSRVFDRSSQWRLKPRGNGEIIVKIYAN